MFIQYIEIKKRHDYFLISIIITTYINAVINYKCLWYIPILYYKNIDYRIQNINRTMLAPIKI